MHPVHRAMVAQNHNQPLKAVYRRLVDNGKKTRRRPSAPSCESSSPSSTFASGTLFKCQLQNWVDDRGVFLVINATPELISVALIDAMKEFPSVQT
jgi:hypothetical protein